jgi:hypothetical protein
VYPDLTEHRTVLSMIARAAFGTSGIGHAGFLLLQYSTMAILVLAANTSFADFPRLANFHAGDAFMPRQFTQRGHRLVFSNGIIALGVAAGGLIAAFGANVSKLIPFYAIGVFTSFSMSQAGMAKRHLRLRESGWRLGLAINGFGALATAVVLVVIAVTKFPDDVAIIILVPVMVFVLVRMNHMYERERAELDEDVERFDGSDVEPPTSVLLVDELDRKTIHALQYAKTLHCRETHAVHLNGDRDATRGLQRRWSDLHVDVPLEIVDSGEDRPAALTNYLKQLGDTRNVNVIIPAPAISPRSRRLQQRHKRELIDRALQPVPGARITVVRDHPGPGHALIDHTEDGARLRVLPRLNHRAVVLVEKADRATMRAIRYAMSLGASDVWAVHAAVDEERERHLIERWMDLRIPVPLDVIECWDRNVTRSLERYVAELMGKRYEVTVVMPRRDYETRRQRLLHDRTSRKIVRALGRYPHVDITAVPYFFRPTGSTERPRTTVTGAE